MTFLKNQINKRKVMTGAVSILIVLILVSAVLFWQYRKTAVENVKMDAARELLFENSSEQMTGESVVSGQKEMSDNAQKETTHLETQQIEDDWRIHGFPYIKLTNQLKEGDYVDIRISFADGGDFVLLSKKQIQGISPLREEGTDALWMVVSEEEILRLSSAVVDAYLNEGCYIYAIQYISDTQKAAIVNYVASDLVKQLMEEDPNIVERAENVQEYSRWKEYETGIQREDVYPEQEEIIYMD